MVGTGPASQLISLKDNGGNTQWHWNLGAAGSPGLNLAESLVADYRLFVQNGGNVGIGTGTPAARLDVNGGARLAGTNPLELGGGVSGKEANAGKIGYQTFSPDALDLVGAGTTADNRKIKLWADGGVALTSLAGTGSRLVTVGANGTLLAEVQTGTATLGTNTGGGVKVVSITFPTAYAATPSRVVCTVRTQNGAAFTDTFAVTTKSLGPLGFDVNITRTDQLTVSGSTATGAAWGQALLLDWVVLP